jgi:hypothetical protein
MKSQLSVEAAVPAAASKILQARTPAATAAYV